MASTSDTMLPKKKQVQILASFCSVTGSDPEKARQYLEACCWNLDLAVNMHVDSNHEDKPSATLDAAIQDNIRAPIPQTRAVLVEEDYLVQNYNFRGMKRRSHSVFDGFRDFRAEAEQQESARTSGKKMTKKLKTLEELFRPPLDIMHRGDFESAKDVGQRSNKWLMVNLQDSQEFSCQVLNRDVWSKESVKQVITEHFIFWQVYNDSVDGQWYTQYYGPVQFPYVAVIDPTTGEKLAVWNDIDSSKICAFVKDFLKNHSSPDGSTVASNASQFCLADQSEDEQLRAALAASLEDSSMPAEDIDSEIETFDSDSNSCEMLASTKPKIEISSIFDEIVPKNASSQPEESKDISIDSNGSSKIETFNDFLGNGSDDRTELILRLPDGNKDMISWPCTSLLKALVLYVEEIGYSLERHELVTNYPRRNLCKLDLGQSLKEADLFPRETIFVQLKQS